MIAYLCVQQLTDAVVSGGNPETCCQQLLGSGLEDTSTAAGLLCVTHSKSRAHLYTDACCIQAPTLLSQGWRHDLCDLHCTQLLACFAGLAAA